MVTTAERLKQLMDTRHLKQADILRLVAPYCEKYMVKLNKSDLSQFVSGKVKPGQSKLSILGLALGVSEGWLMGLPVPMERSDSDNEDSANDSEKKPATKGDGEDEELIYLFSLLTPEEKAMLRAQIKGILASRKQ